MQAEGESGPCCGEGGQCSDVEKNEEGEKR